MSITWVRARCACDDCGAAFTVEMDPASRLGPDVAEAVEGALRGGELAEGPGSCSFYDGVQRCGPCTDAYVTGWIAANPRRVAGAQVVSWLAPDWPHRVRVELYNGESFEISASLVDPTALLGRLWIPGFGFAS